MMARVKSSLRRRSGVRTPGRTRIARILLRTAVRRPHDNRWSTERAAEQPGEAAPRTGRCGDANAPARTRPRAADEQAGRRAEPGRRLRRPGPLVAQSV